MTVRYLSRYKGFFVNTEICYQGKSLIINPLLYTILVVIVGVKKLDSQV